VSPEPPPLPPPSGDMATTSQGPSAVERLRGREPASALSTDSPRAIPERQCHKRAALGHAAQGPGLEDEDKDEDERRPHETPATVQKTASPGGLGGPVVGPLDDKCGCHPQPPASWGGQGGAVQVPHTNPRRPRLGLTQQLSRWKQRNVPETQLSHRVVEKDRGVTRPGQPGLPGPLATTDFPFGFGDEVSRGAGTTFVAQCVLGRGLRTGHRLGRAGRPLCSPWDLHGPHSLAPPHQ
jgi:hypothetical protein